MRVEFRLTMPSVGSWDGRWFGEGKNYLLVRNLSAEELERLGLPKIWRHRWEDGWAAQIDGRLMKRGERQQKSDGFCGYEWMVDRILRWGDTTCRCEWTPDPNWDGYEHCRFCGTSRRIREESDA